jgi:leader peptidase (prepilin peptidase)/N-methyltransferase
MLYHLVFVSLLVAATGTDLRDYVVPDAITVSGLLIAVLGATVAGHMQIIHLWVDWNREMPMVGPYIPPWIAAHHHWHGLAWSIAGAAAGGGITWLVRTLSTLILGREALGFGDVTLMAMIGAFLGWQPVLLVFLLAPVCGIVVALFALLSMNRPYVPYGPFLCVAALAVLLSWHWLWTPMQKTFGHGPSLALLGGVALAALIVLLGAMRLYRLIPGKNRPSQE